MVFLTMVAKASLITVVLMRFSSSQAGKIVGPFPDGVPGSGYGCDNKCNGGDLNYVIRAVITNYTVNGTSNTPLSKDGENVSMFTRTFVGVPEESSPFCFDDYDGSSGPLGPCLRVFPGKRVAIRVENHMKNGMELLQQVPTTVNDYFEKIAPEAEFLGRLPANVLGMEVSQENIPGQDASFDDTNIHLHGMQVVPHLFYPMGTGNATAEWITIKPENENGDQDQQCFCYIFDIPEDHPQGTWFWHIHRHGSASMQAWQGMVGYIYVGDVDSPGAPDYELSRQGVTRDEQLALWEWTVDPTKTLPGEPTTYVEGSFLEGAFLGGVTTTYLVNNEFRPTFSACVNETIHFRLLCAQTATGSLLQVLDTNDHNVPFWVFASDGISYSRAYQKEKIVVGSGQREGVLMKFSEPGTYRLMQGLIGFAGGDPVSNVTAFVEVVDTGCSNIVNVDPEELKFTPGMNYNITNDQISASVDVAFSVHKQKDLAPAPQYLVNNKAFSVSKISQSVDAATGQQWTLTSNTDDFHPFHIHVNPFQVKQIFSGDLPANFSTAVFDTNLIPENMWRDTVYIPPYGTVILYQMFGGQDIAFSGKTVYHCHLLTHEDQGMMAGVMIEGPNSQDSTESIASFAEVSVAPPVRETPARLMLSISLLILVVVT